jgi:hypothetical protein
MTPELGVNLNPWMTERSFIFKIPCFTHNSSDQRNLIIQHWVHLAASDQSEEFPCRFGFRHLNNARLILASYSFLQWSRRNHSTKAALVPAAVQTMSDGQLSGTR